MKEIRLRNKITKSQETICTVKSITYIDYTKRWKKLHKYVHFYGNTNSNEFYKENGNYEIEQFYPNGNLKEVYKYDSVYYAYPIYRCIYDENGLIQKEINYEKDVFKFGIRDVETYIANTLIIDVEKNLKIKIDKKIPVEILMSITKDGVYYWQLQGHRGGAPDFIIQLDANTGKVIEIKWKRYQYDSCP